MPQITHVRTESTGTHPKHITNVKLSNGDEKTRATVVNEIDSGTSYYYTKGGGQTGYVETVHPSGETPYIRTKSDSTTADNLLKLPRF
ncbi:hypothetical protein AAC03nite_28250 [Alicyclobacillus acidoterrestris]|nr:hypothetical protein AAC03nite_28250 [Alicyclobacillus acidoterrestris]